jgi:Domain of unknown function (DUF932)
MVNQNQNVKEIQSLQAGNPVVQAVDMPFDFNRQDNTWTEKYGITTMPLLVRSVNGELYDDKRFKGVFKDNKFKRIVGRQLVVLPNEEVKSQLVEYIEKSNSGLEMFAEHTSHFGDAAYWIIRSAQDATVVGKDKVNIGCCVRNSIGTYVALGADMFTYRYICKNGAIAKGQDLGTIAIRHIGNRDNMMVEFQRGIERMIDRTAELVDIYRKSVKIEMNKKIAEALAKRIPQRALPKTVQVQKDGTILLTGSQNLWQAFNDVTQKTWHHEKTSFLTKRHIELHAHKVMIQAVAAA